MAVELYPLEIHDVVSRSVIIIDEMHLNVQLRNYADKLKKANNFGGYCLAVISTSLSLMTASFQNWLLPAQAWHSLFMLVDGGLIVLTFLSGKAWFQRKEITPEELIANIKSCEAAQSHQPVQTSPF